MNILVIFVFSLSISIGEFVSVPDGFVDKSKMNAWNLKSFASLSKEESEKRFEDTDEDGDSIISGDEYKRAEFDLDKNPSTRFVRETNSSNPSILCRVVSIHSMLKSKNTIKCLLDINYFLVG